MKPPPVPLMNHNE